MDNFFTGTLMSALTSGAEWPTILLFLGIGAIYFLAPAAGYTIGSRGRLAAALWFLVAKVALGLVRMMVLTMAMFEQTNPSWRAGGGPPSNRGGSLIDPNSLTALSMQVGLPVLEMAMLGLAMIMFVLGLQGLHRQPPIPMATALEEPPR